MIRIYDKEEQQFTSLGLGSLNEAIRNDVIEQLNGGFELEMEYPIVGRHFHNIKLRNIIYCKANPYSDYEPFRIYSITKPINGIVTINAEHISYDMSGITVLPKRNEEKDIISYGEEVTETIDGSEKTGYRLDTVLSDINTSTILESDSKNPFTISRNHDKNNVFKEEGYSIPIPINLRSMLSGTEGSILEKYKGEWKFEKFNAYLYNKRGKDRNLTIRYGKNMLDLEQEIDSNNQFTGIFPFYSKTYTETHTSQGYIFQKAYIRDSKATPLRHDWLTLMDTTNSLLGILPTAMVPLIESSQILVSGVTKYITKLVAVEVESLDQQYNGNLYAFRKNRKEDGNLHEVYISSRTTGPDLEIINTLIHKDSKATITPTNGSPVIYIVKGVYTSGTVTEDTIFLNKNITYDNNEYQEYNSDGFYTRVYKATPDMSETFIENYDEPYIEDGLTYVKPRKPSQVTTSVDKYIYSDLIGYDNSAVPAPTNPFENGIFYVNQELKNLETQKILTLDLTSELDGIENFDVSKLTEQRLQEWLYDKAEQYMKEKDLNKIKESITISFIKLSDSPEYEHFKNLEVVELGDEVTVIYDDLGVRSKHRVISTDYNVLTDSYNEIELGDKVGSIVNTVVVSGDGISNLENDADYGDKEYIKNLVAENLKVVTANIEHAIVGYLEATNASIDQLVSTLLTADNATISEVLQAGNIKVTGHIEALSGIIGGSKIQNGELIVSTRIAIGEDESDNIVFEVNSNGEVTARDLKILGGAINVGGNFHLDNEGNLITNSISIKNDYGQGEYVDIDSNGVFIRTDMDVKNLKVITDLSAKKIKFKVSNNEGELGISTEENRAFQEVTVSWTLYSLPDPSGNSYSIILTADKELINNRNFNARYMVAITNNDGSTSISPRSKSITILQGEDSGNGTVIIDSSKESIISVNVNNNVFIEYLDDTPATKYIYTDSAFGPENDDDLELGLPNKQWKDVYISNQPIVGSDRNIKKDINYDISNYDELFDRLKPSSFKYKNGESGRTHIGFISQDLKDILEELDMDSSELAAYVRAPKDKNQPLEERTDDDYRYSIRYTEFIALLVDQVQKLKQEVKELKTKIE